MPLISLKDVSKLYGFGDATTVALDEVSLDVEAGEFVAIMGPSGSGKSTLLNIIGLLDRPTHGEYTLSKRSVAKLRPNQRAKTRRDRIGFVFQAFNLLPKLNVIDNVALPLLYKGVTPVRRQKRAAAVLERVGLTDRQYFMPPALSGGQIQRAAIARALVNDPQIIIADEPTGNLDSTASLVVMELLSELHRTGNTILMVTHNPELTRYADRVLYMLDGAIVSDQATPVGHVPRLANEAHKLFPADPDEVGLAGISAVMETLPDKTIGAPKKKLVSRKGRATKSKIVRKRR